jgi:hypothetical protein
MLVGRADHLTHRAIGLASSTELEGSARGAAAIFTQS